MYCAVQNFETDTGASELHPYLTKSVLWQPKVFKLKCAEDTYNDEKRIKYTLNAIEDADFTQESQVGDSILVTYLSLVWICITGAPVCLSPRISI